MLATRPDGTVPTDGEEKDAGLVRQQGFANLPDGSLYSDRILAPRCLSGRDQRRPADRPPSAMKPALESPGCLVAIDNAGQSLRRSRTIMATPNQPLDERGRQRPELPVARQPEVLGDRVPVRRELLRCACCAPATSSPLAQQLLAVLPSALSLRALSAHQHRCDRAYHDPQEQTPFAMNREQAEVNRAPASLNRRQRVLNRLPRTLNRITANFFDLIRRAGTLKQTSR